MRRLRTSIHQSWLQLPSAEGRTQDTHAEQSGRNYVDLRRPESPSTQDVCGRPIDLLGIALFGSKY